MSSPILVDIYSKPMQGGELPYFVGKQYGSGWLQTLGRLAFPIIKKVGRFLGNTAKDVLVNQKPIKESFKSNALDEVAQVVPEVVSRFTDRGTQRPPPSAAAAPPPKRRKVINNRRKARGTIFQRK